MPIALTASDYTYAQNAEPLRKSRRNPQATKGKSEFQFPIGTTIVGWEPYCPQPPKQPATVKKGAIAPKEDGTEAAFIRWLNWGGQQEQPEAQPTIPPLPRWNKGVVAPKDDGTEYLEPTWFNIGFQDPQPETQPFYPQWTRSTRAAGFLPKDDGNYATLNLWPLFGEFAQEWQPPTLGRFYRPGGVMPVEMGTEAAYINTGFVPFIPGWEDRSIHFRRPPLPHSALKHKSEFAFFPVPFPWAWGVQEWQPPHRKPERSGSILRGDEGNYDFFHPWINIGGGEDYQADLRRIRFYSPAVAADFAQDVYSATVAPVPIQNGWWDSYSMLKRPPLPLSALKFTSSWSFWPEYQPMDWPSPDAFGTLFKRFYKSPDPSNGGDEEVYSFVPPVPVTSFWGHEQPWAATRIRVEGRGAAIAGRSQFGAFTIDGWIDDPWHDIRNAARKPWRPDINTDSGSEKFFPLIGAPLLWNEFNNPIIRPVPRQWKTLYGANNAEAQPIIQMVTSPWGHAFNDPMLRKPWIRVLADKIDGTVVPAGTITISNVDGWSIQYSDVPHPRPERSGSTALGDIGIVLPYISVIQFPQFGFEPILHVSQKGGVRWYNPDTGDNGVEFPFAQWRNYGWGLQEQQPPHPAPEKRAAAIMPKEDGQEWPFIFWKNFGWEPVLHNGIWLVKYRQSPATTQSSIDARTSQIVPPGLLPGEFFANMQLSSRTQFNGQRYGAIAQPPPNAGDWVQGNVPNKKNFQRMFIANVGRVMTVEYD